jgi:hypothetical protein
MRAAIIILAPFLLLSLSPTLMAHPIPDIPVRASFDAEGTCTIRVEVDPRCFYDDPEDETYLTKVQLEKLVSPAEADELKATATALIQRGVEFFFEPQGEFEPEFTWEFTAMGGGPLVKFDDPAVITGTWRTKVPEGLAGYRLHATDKIAYAVVFENTLRGTPVERTAVLFPGEKSFTLQMDGGNATVAAAPPAITYVPDAKDQGRNSPWLVGGALLVAALLALWLARLGRT